ncbi:cation:proton antiporter [Candidatus Woesearchaeota archaeon]|nr:cation:proton antiporter [Candidatus Woesearchaeota archaeon]
MESLTIILDIGLMIIVATAFAYVLRFFKQPLIPAYILTGIVLGPVLGLLHDLSVMRILAEIGIAFLLFIVGLELDLKKLKDIGNVASVGAIVQIAVLFGLGFLVSTLLGFGRLASAYLGLIMAFSSTMVVIKLLSDKHELDTLHGRIVIGILLMQDLVAILALTVLQDKSGFAFYPFLVSLAKGVALLVIAVLFGKFIFPAVFKFAAKHQELLFIASLAVCFSFSILFSLAGFSIAIGAFIAGITLANLPYNVEIAGKVKSLRDFFSVLFFTSIGAELVLTSILPLLLPLLILTAFTIILLPVITIFITALFGYKTRTSFMTGIALAQVSEFGFIIALLGKDHGILDEQAFSLIVLLALVTMAVTAYFIKYDDWLYKRVGRWFKPLERLGKASRELSYVRQDRGHDYVLIGMDRIGYSIFRKIHKMHKDVVVVDFNPDIIKRLIQQHVPCIYGDIGDAEILEKLRLKHVKMVISTIPDHADNLLLIGEARKENKDATVIVTSYSVEDALSLYEEGADYVIIPHYLGGEHVSVLLEDVSLDLDKLITARLMHIKELRHRQHVHPHHH